MNALDSGSSTGLSVFCGDYECAGISESVHKPANQTRGVQVPFPQQHSAGFALPLRSWDCRFLMLPYGPSHALQFRSLVQASPDYVCSSPATARSRVQSAAAATSCSKCLAEEPSSTGTRGFRPVTSRDNLQQIIGLQMAFAFRHPLQGGVTPLTNTHH